MKDSFELVTADWAVSKQDFQSEAYENCSTEKTILGMQLNKMGKNIKECTEMW